MRSQYLKDLYYLSVGKISILSFYWHKYFSSRRWQTGYLNIGCGDKYIDGMINLDGNIFRKKDIWLDVTLGLPFSDCSIDAIYASHLLEHFTTVNARKLLEESHRVLKPGGVVRLVVPSLEYAIKAYNEERLANFPEWPEKFDSIGGRFNNFMLCSNQHFLIFDFSFLDELLKEAGFATICREEANHSAHFIIDHLRFESDPSIKDSSLFVEALKLRIS
jgi:predicted SAM-dependent methyltransferase